MMMQESDSWLGMIFSGKSVSTIVLVLVVYGGTQSIGSSHTIHPRPAAQKVLR
jgi:hypothetical protein